MDYIKETVFNAYLIYIFKVLEDSNFFTTLVEIKKDKDNKLDKNIIDKIKTKILDSIKIDNKSYEPKFIFNYEIPGLYNLYKNLSNFIIENVTI